MCSGKGVCDWDAYPNSYPVCKCNDVNDTSTGCFFSPPNDPNMAATYSISLLTITVTVATGILMIIM